MTSLRVPVGCLHQATVDIFPARGVPRPRFAELWQSRGLLGFLVWRDVKVRYAQTALGVAWVVLQPVLTMAIFTVIFGRFAGVPSDGAPYALFALAALIPWTYFSNALAGASSSLVQSRALLHQVYFCRLLVPLAPVGAGLLDAAIALLVLVPVLALFAVPPSPVAIVMLPAMLGVAALAAAGFGFWLSAVNLRYRDVRHAVPFLLQAWMFASPVVYPISVVPERYRLLFAINPMVGVIDGFRSAILGHGRPDWPLVGVSAAAACAAFVAGATYLRWSERTFVDVA